jgi:hypothetical protein
VFDAELLLNSRHSVFNNGCEHAHDWCAAPGADRHPTASCHIVPEHRSATFPELAVIGSNEAALYGTLAVLIFNTN